MWGAPAALAADAPYDKHTLIVKYADSASGGERLDTAARSGVIETLGTITGFTARLVRRSSRAATRLAVRPRGATGSTVRSTISAPPVATRNSASGA